MPTPREAEATKTRQADDCHGLAGEASLLQPQPVVPKPKPAGSQERKPNADGHDVPAPNHDR